MKFKEFIVKIQNFPENKKKIILWTIVIILAIIMGYFWVNSVMKSFSKITESVKSINLSSTSILQTTTPSNK